jgi:hypothetical protein
MRKFAIDPNHVNGLELQLQGDVLRDDGHMAGTARHGAVLLLLVALKCLGRGAKTREATAGVPPERIQSYKIMVRSFFGHKL